MATDAVILGSLGIVTSGVLGPAAAARWARSRQEREFQHDLSTRRTDDLRRVLDDAAVLLGAGVTNLRLAAEASQSHHDPPPEVREWASQVHLARERILLRLPEDSVVVSRYTEARDLLTDRVGLALEADAGRPGAGETGDDLSAAIEQFEDRRSAFLAAGRALLEQRQASRKS